MERIYNVPLRREWLKVPRHRRAKKAMTALKAFLKKHMKTDDVKIGKFLNEIVWAKGMRSPPHHVKINVLKEGDVVRAELFGKPLKPEKKEKKGLAEKLGLKGKTEEKTEEKKTEDKKAKAEKKETAVKEEAKSSEEQ